VTRNDARGDTWPVRRVLALLMALCFGSGTAAAQRTAHLADLTGRVSPGVLAQVTALGDSARALGLPLAPLVDKAMEGASKHASDPRIIAAVRAMLADLSTARHALGARAGEAELTAGVAALRAGVPASTLVALRHGLGARPLTVPLSVLGGLVVQGVPTSLATATVLRQASGADDSRLLAFGDAVTRSIARGVPPRVALSSEMTASALSTAPRPAPPRAPKP